MLAVSGTLLLRVVALFMKTPEGLCESTSPGLLLFTLGVGRVEERAAGRSVDKCSSKRRRGDCSGARFVD